MADDLECPFSRDDDDFIDFEIRTHDLGCGGAPELPPLMPALKGRQDPMELYNDSDFIIRNHFTKRTVYGLLKLLIAALPYRFLIAFWFYGADILQRGTGDLAGMSQSIVCWTVYKVRERNSRNLYSGLWTSW